MRAHGSATSLRGPIMPQQKPFPLRSEVAIVAGRIAIAPHRPVRKVVLWRGWVRPRRRQWTVSQHHDPHQLWNIPKYLGHPLWMPRYDFSQWMWLIELIHSGIEWSHISELSSRWDFVASLAPVVWMPGVDLSENSWCWSSRKYMFICNTGHRGLMDFQEMDKRWCSAAVLLRVLDCKQHLQVFKVLHRESASSLGGLLQRRKT